MFLVLFELPEAQENEVDSRHDYSWATDATVSWARHLVAGEAEAYSTWGSLTRTGLISPYPARQAASIVALAAFNVAWVSRAILPFAIKLRSLAFRVVVE